MTHRKKNSLDFFSSLQSIKWEYKKLTSTKRKIHDEFYKNNYPKLTKKEKQKIELPYKIQKWSALYFTITYFISPFLLVGLFSTLVEKGPGGVNPIIIVSSIICLICIALEYNYGLNNPKVEVVKPIDYYDKLESKLRLKVINYSCYLDDIKYALEKHPLLYKGIYEHIIDAIIFISKLEKTIGVIPEINEFKVSAHKLIELHKEKESNFIEYMVYERFIKANKI